jgi:hypothetical protein
MLRAALFIALLVLCSAQSGPPIGSLNQYAGLSSGWQDLSAWGGPSVGISSELLQSLSGVAKTVFTISVDAVESKLDSAGSLTRALPAGAAAGVGFAAGVAVGKATSGLHNMHRPPPPGPPLPPLPKGHKLAPWASKHEVLIGLLAEKWSGALVKAQVSHCTVHTVTVWGQCSCMLSWRSACAVKILLFSGFKPAPAKRKPLALTSEYQRHIPSQH